MLSLRGFFSHQSAQLETLQRSSVRGECLAGDCNAMRHDPVLNIRGQSKMSLDKAEKIARNGLYHSDSRAKRVRAFPKISRCPPRPFHRGNTRVSDERMPRRLFSIARRPVCVGMSLMLEDLIDRYRANEERADFGSWPQLKTSLTSNQTSDHHSLSFVSYARPPIYERPHGPSTSSYRPSIAARRSNELRIFGRREPEALHTEMRELQPELSLSVRKCNAGKLI